MAENELGQLRERHRVSGLRYQFYFFFFCNSLISNRRIKFFCIALLFSFLLIFAHYYDVLQKFGRSSLIFVLRVAEEIDIAKKL